MVFIFSVNSVDFRCIWRKRWWPRAGVCPSEVLEGPEEAISASFHVISVDSGGNLLLSGSNTRPVRAFGDHPGRRHHPRRQQSPFPTSLQFSEPLCRKFRGKTFQVTTSLAILTRFLSSLATSLRIETQLIHLVSV